MIPVHHGGQKFRQCLTSVIEGFPQAFEIIVVADGDTDGCWRHAEELGARLLRLSVAGGPARARNAGAFAASGEILFFVDADVVIPPDAGREITDIFRAQPDVAAVFGSYDDEPAESNFLSQYKNLFHHYVHQISREEASTFWGACGAIRRDVFVAIGGFDERYRRPSIEDIELGYRLRRKGYRIRLIKELRVKHLKRWDVFSLVATDFFSRALPWTELIVQEGRFIDDLNLRVSNRMSVLFVHLLVLTMVSAFFSRWMFIPLFLFAAGLFLINRDVYRFFRAKRGLVFTAKTVPWHWFYFYYSGVAFLLGVVRQFLKRVGIIRGGAAKAHGRLPNDGISAVIDNEQ